MQIILKLYIWYFLLFNRHLFSCPYSPILVNHYPPNCYCPKPRDDPSFNSVSDNFHLPRLPLLSTLLLAFCNRMVACKEYINSVFLCSGFQVVLAKREPHQEIRSNDENKVRAFMFLAPCLWGCFCPWKPTALKVADYTSRFYFPHFSNSSSSLSSGAIEAMTWQLLAAGHVTLPCSPVFYFVKGPSLTPYLECSWEPNIYFFFCVFPPVQNPLLSLYYHLVSHAYLLPGLLQ